MATTVVDVAPGIEALTEEVIAEVHMRVEEEDVVVVVTLIIMTHAITVAVEVEDTIVAVIEWKILIKNHTEQKVQQTIQIVTMEVVQGLLNVKE